MKIAIQMDHPSVLNPAGDSTIVLMKEAVKRGYRLYYYHHTTLCCQDNAVRATVYPLTLTGKNDHWYQLEDAQPHTALSDMDIILMRQDPPFDMSYITTTYLLDRVGGKTRVINNPTAVRSHSEKLLPLDYADAMPATLISADSDDILAFLHQHHDIIIKPLYGWGGHAVLRLRKGGDNTQTLLEMIRERDNLPLIAQPFLPDVVYQDIRVVIIHGQIAGAFTRTPATGEIRANMRVGGIPIAHTLNSVQQAICERIAPDMQHKGLHIVGLDLIGDKLTEINVTSPTGLKTLELLYQSKPATLFWNALQH